MPLEDVHEVESTNWKAVSVAVALVAFGGAAASLLPFPYGWIVGSAIGIALLFLGMKLKRTPLVKDFSRQINEPNLIITDSLEAQVIKASEQKNS